MKIQERDTVITEKYKMGAACKTAVALRAAAEQGYGVFESDRQESSNVDVWYECSQTRTSIEELYLRPVALARWRAR